MPSWTDPGNQAAAEGLLLRKTLLVGLACLGMIALGSTLGPPVKKVSADPDQTFIANCTTPAEQSFTVVLPVTRIGVTLMAAQGASTTSNANTRAGGAGATVQAFFNVTPGQYFLDLGCQGIVTAGGFNGGGAGGGSVQFDGGGGGGGATVLRRTACGSLPSPCVSDANTMMVAGGGGGAGETSAPASAAATLLIVLGARWRQCSARRRRIRRDKHDFRRRWSAVRSRWQR